MSDTVVGVIEVWVGVYLVGVGVGVLEMTWFAWRTRNADEGSPGWFWRQYVAVILTWPVVLGWLAWDLTRRWRRR